MNKLVTLALAAAFTTLAVVPTAIFAAETQSVQTASDSVASSVSVVAGKMLYGPDSKRIAAIYRVTTDGAAQVILGGKLVTVPASSLSEANGKVTTSLTKKDLQAAR